jgi:hypothetical protein
MLSIWPFGLDSRSQQMRIPMRPPIYLALFLVPKPEFDLAFQH